MREELGDVLVQVVFHAQLAAERGDFDFDDVAREINEKLVRRHPHVFGAGRLDTSAEVLVQWDAIKRTEKQATGKSRGSRFQAPAAAAARPDVCRGGVEADREEAAAGRKPG